MGIFATVTGDVLKQTDTKLIAHGVNCEGVMGAGVALQIKNKWPHVYRDYATYCWRSRESNILGTYLSVLADDIEHVVFNMFTQASTGYGKQVSYDAVHDSFKALNDNWENYHNLNYKSILAIPMIGAGLGGGNWDIISKIIDDVTPNIQIQVYKFQG